MCGFSGFVTAAGNGAADPHAAIAAMTGPLRHRGPDEHRYWVDPEAHVALGHRRLSILDLSPAGHQPMLSASGRYVLTFNGEIYNHAVLRAELEAGRPAPAWRGTSDTEVLVEAIDRFGVAQALQRAKGMFAFAVWDRRTRRLTLARDRMGEKPLYYGWSNGAFLFGSELRALRAFPGFSAPIDRRALSLYFSLTAVPAPHSIHEGVYKLKPGCLLELDAADGPDPGRLRVEPYWRLEDSLGAPRFEGSAAEAQNRLEALLTEAVRLQMVADVPVGAFLSGGIDSSTIVALMQSLSPRPVRTFSIGFAEQAFNEAPHAKAVAAHLGTDHTELMVSANDALGLIPDLPAIWDEPFADTSMIPTALVAALARRDVTVSLSGDGGDELFCGYDRYFDARLLGRLPMKRLLRHALHPRATPLIAALVRLAPGRLSHRVTTSRLNTLREIIAGDGGIDHYLEMTYQPRLNGGLARGDGRTPYPLTDFTPPPGLDYLSAVSGLDAATYLPDDILTKVDRAAMAVSLETRVPLLDHDVVEFAARLPMEMKLLHGQSKWPLRALLYKHVPREMVERPKMGFGVPVGEWLRGPLRAWAHDLLPRADDDLLDASLVGRLWAEHQSGALDRQATLWRVLMFQAWRRAYGG